MEEYLITVREAGCAMSRVMEGASSIGDAEIWWLVCEAQSGLYNPRFAARSIAARTGYDHGKWHEPADHCTSYEDAVRWINVVAARFLGFPFDAAIDILGAIEAASDAERLEFLSSDAKPSILYLGDGKRVRQDQRDQISRFNVRYFYKASYAIAWAAQFWDQVESATAYLTDTAGRRITKDGELAFRVSDSNPCAWTTAA